MKEIKPALLLFVLFTILCGGLYPTVVTGLANLLFPRQAGGRCRMGKAKRAHHVWGHHKNLMGTACRPLPILQLHP